MSIEAEAVQTGYPGQPWTLIVFITRKPGTSREEFSLHWQNTRAVLWGLLNIVRQASAADSPQRGLHFGVLPLLGTLPLW